MSAANCSLCASIGHDCPRCDAAASGLAVAGHVASVATYKEHNPVHDPPPSWQPSVSRARCSCGWWATRTHTFGSGLERQRHAFNDMTAHIAIDVLGHEPTVTTLPKPEGIAAAPVQIECACGWNSGPVAGELTEDGSRAAAYRRLRGHHTWAIARAINDERKGA